FQESAIQRPAGFRRALADLGSTARFMKAFHFRFPIAHESFERFVRRPRRACRFHFFHHLLFFGAGFVGGGFVLGPIENRGGTSFVMSHNSFSFLVWCLSDPCNRRL